MATYQRPKSTKNQKTDAAEKIVHRLDKGAGRFETFLEKYKKQLTYVVLILVVLVLGGYGYHTWVAKPSQAEATEELTFAQQAYEMDSLHLALDGTPANPGLVKIADRYSSTEAGNVAKYLAGAAYYRLGQYEQAISYLEKYVGKDEVTPAEALGMIGDCYAQLDRPEEALKYYEKAAAKRDNSFTAPFYLMKAGNMAIYLKKYSVAEKHFRAIKDNYPESAQAATVDKYIEFAAGAAKNFK